MDGQGYRALIVDDEWIVRQLTRNALTTIGIECHFAGNGQQALEAARKTAYDVVISDLMMPEMNGHDFCRELLELPGEPVIIVLTAVTNPEIAVDLMERGIDDVQFKPVNYYAFMAKVRALLARRKAGELRASLKESVD